MIATNGFTKLENKRYYSIFADDDYTSTGNTITFHFQNYDPENLDYLYYPKQSKKELLNIENALRSIKAVASLARNYLAKIINIAPCIRVFSIIKMMFSRSGYLPWRVRNRRKSK